MDNQSSNKAIGLIGASSLVGQLLLQQLVNKGAIVNAYTRQPIPTELVNNVRWLNYPSDNISFSTKDSIELMICVAPIWVLAQHLPFLKSLGVRRIVVLSSTSRFTKNNSNDAYEQNIVRRLIQAESELEQWASINNIEWVILRPTLIYGLGQDKNISEIARFIQRFGFFPLFGQAGGLRQPVHAFDVANACHLALFAKATANKAYNISGAETLSYKDMVRRVFNALRKQQRILSVPLLFFKMAVFTLRLLPRYRHWSSAMAERMNQDLVFDNSLARKDFNFDPQKFELKNRDIPK